MIYEFLVLKKLIKLFKAKKIKFKNRLHFFQAIHIILPKKLNNKMKMLKRLLISAINSFNPILH